MNTLEIKDSKAPLLHRANATEGRSATTRLGYARAEFIKRVSDTLLQRLKFRHIGTDGVIPSASEDRAYSIVAGILDDVRQANLLEALDTAIAASETTEDPQELERIAYGRLAAEFSDSETLETLAAAILETKGTVLDGGLDLQALLARERRKATLLAQIDYRAETVRAGASNAIAMLELPYLVNEDLHTLLNAFPRQDISMGGSGAGVRQVLRVVALMDEECLGRLEAIAYSRNIRRRELLDAIDSRKRALAAISEEA